MGRSRTSQSGATGTAVLARVRAGSLAARILVAVSFVAWPAASAGADQKAYLIDDFDGARGLQSWQFFASPGVAIAGDELTLGPGHREHGAMLAYRLPCKEDTGCGAYAAAIYRPPSPLPTRRDPAISLWIRCPPDVEVSLVTKDTSRQTRRFPILASLEHSKVVEWEYVVVRLSAKRAGGAAGDVTGGIKGRLIEIDIVVQARTPVTVQGSVNFDDIQLREASETFRIDPAALAKTPPFGYLDSTPRLGVNIHLLREDRDLDMAKAAGFTFVRMDMLWENVERRGRYRFFAYDRLLRALDARGMGVLWILDYGHPDHGGSTPRTPSDVAAFSRFAGAAAEHFKGRNVQYEIWNEPNTSQFWEPAPDASEYAALLQEAVAAIRSADPLAKVSSGGVSRVDQAFLLRAVNPNVGGGLTAIGIHPYPKTEPESIAPELGTLRDWVANALGERIEIWDTEWGYSSSDGSKDARSNGHGVAARGIQAALAVREILTVWAIGLPLAVWYDLRDDGPDATNPEQNYGLLDSSGNEKPAMKALRTLMGAASGRKYAGMIREIPKGIHAMRFDGSTDTILIVWTDQPMGRRTIEYAKQDLISATGLMGDAIKSKDRPAGQLRVQIEGASGPIYLRWSVRSRGALPPGPVAAPALTHSGWPAANLFLTNNAIPPSE